MLHIFDDVVWCHCRRIKNIYKGGGREKVKVSPRFELKIAGVQVRSGSHCTYLTNENALKFTSPSIYFHRWGSFASRIVTLLC